jgi:hypothetical protein
MKRPDLLFSFEPRPEVPLCDVCMLPPRAGAVLVHLRGRAIEAGGIASLVCCATCAAEIACVVVREFWPRAPPDPPPDTPPASGGGSE